MPQDRYKFSELEADINDALGDAKDQRTRPSEWLASRSKSKAEHVLAWTKLKPMYANPLDGRWLTESQRQSLEAEIRLANTNISRAEKSISILEQGLSKSNRHLIQLMVGLNRKLALAQRKRDDPSKQAWRQDYEQRVREIDELKRRIRQELTEISAVPAAAPLLPHEPNPLQYGFASGLFIGGRNGQRR